MSQRTATVTYTWTSSVRPVRVTSAVPVAMRSNASRTYGWYERAGIGELHPPADAMEQLHAEAPLELGHLVADGRLGHRQLLGRGAEAQSAGGRLEGTQRGERWQVRHAVDDT